MTVKLNVPVVEDAILASVVLNDALRAALPLNMSAPRQLGDRYLATPTVRRAARCKHVSWAFAGKYNGNAAFRVHMHL